MSQAIIWLARRLNLGAVLALALLFTGLISVLVSLASLVRGLDGSVLVTLAPLAVFCGWGSARYKVRGWLGAPGLIALGLAVTLIIIGGVGPHFLAALRAISLYAWQIAGWPQRTGDPLPAVAALLELLTPVNVILMRLRDWAAALRAEQPAYDPVATTFMWGMMTWLISAWAGWWLKQYRAIAAMTPVLGLMAFVVAYRGASQMYLLPPLGALLLLLPLTRQQDRERRWARERVDFSEDIRVDLIGHTGLVAAALLVAAAVIPSISIDSITEFVRDLSGRNPGQSNPAESLGLEAPPPQISAFDPLRAPGLPRRHLIGSGPELSEHVVMLVSVTDPASSETGPNRAISESYRFYWREVTYDVYTGRGWATSPIDSVTYRPNIPIASVAFPAQYRVDVWVQGVDPLDGIVYVPGQLVTMDSEFAVAWRSGQDLFGATVPANAYTLESIISAPDEGQLLTARNLYPEAIFNRYLTLPDSTPPRVLALARQLTASAATPYERARAIESYLRAFPYTLDLPAPPLNVDVADYFLFDLKRGYCDYYATAMVVLARAAGLPARLVTGYASGTYQADENRFIVTQADAHSWVEIYFDGFGWVEFEPTGGRLPIDRSQLPLAASFEFETTQSPASTLPGTGASPAWLLSLACAVGAIGYVSAVWVALDRFRLGRMTPVQTAIALYTRLTDHAGHLSVPRRNSDTPHEFSRALAERLARAPRRLRPHASEVTALVELYVRTIYSPHPPTRAEQQQAIRVWAGLNWKFWGMRLTPARLRALLGRGGKG